MNAATPMPVPGNDSAALMLPVATLRQVAGFTPRQGVISAALIGACGALAWERHAMTWLALFAILLAPLLVAGVAAHTGMRLLPRNTSWRVVWLVLLALIALAAWLALVASQRWVPAKATLGTLQVLAYAGGSGVLLLALPLWHLQSQSAALQLSALRQAALSSELKALQAQIEPHFLYNTLANTRYLARHDPDKAVQMLDHLIAYLHGALPDMRSSASTLAREFELAGHYLALMAIRFGTRLTYALDCPPALAAASMPPLLLMSLVENAVRHGVEPTPGAVHVRLTAQERDGALCVAVCDDGASTVASTFGSGVGLRNLRARLQAQFNGAATFELRIEPGQATEAELRLPLELRA